MSRVLSADVAGVSATISSIKAICSACMSHSYPYLARDSMIVDVSGAFSGGLHLHRKYGCVCRSKAQLCSAISLRTAGVRIPLARVRGN
jgi:hypothetical protein